MAKMSKLNVAVESGADAVEVRQSCVSSTLHILMKLPSRCPKPGGPSGMPISELILNLPFQPPSSQNPIKGMCALAAMYLAPKTSIGI